jgi:hypothetical protein
MIAPLGHADLLLFDEPWGRNGWVVSGHDGGQAQPEEHDIIDVSCIVHHASCTNRDSVLVSFSRSATISAAT